VPDPGRAQDRFLRVASHELRTPLTSIRGYAEELLEDGGAWLPAAQRASAAAILRNADRLGLLIEDMLLVARLDGGHVEPEPSDLELGRIVAELVEDARAGADRDGVGLEVRAARAPLSADERLVRRAVRGLLRNGLADSPRGSILRVAVGEEGGAVRLVVRDRGGVLSEEDRRRATERFHRAETTGARAGTGLELAIARGVAAAHGGRLELAPDGDDGTAVALVLPAVA
jgi:two-component system OmpR family sensor kinase